MLLAVCNGPFEVVLFLHANRSEGIAANAFRDAATCVKFPEFVQWLHSTYPDAVDVNTLCSHGR